MDESATSTKEEGSSTRPWKKPRDRQQHVGKSWERNGHSDQSGVKNGKFNKPRGGDARDFKTKGSGGKKHTEIKKNSEGKLHRRDVGSNHKKRGRKE